MSRMPLLLISAVLLSVPSGKAQSCSSDPGCPWSSWTVCITAAGSYCVLEEGTYTVGSTLVPANGVTMAGAGTSNYGTELVRQAGFTGYLIDVPSGVSATIYYMTIDGNRADYPNDQSGCVSSEGSACGPPGGYGCVQANYTADDVYVDGTVTINLSNFWTALGSSISIRPDGSGAVTNNAIYYAASTGTYIWNSATVQNNYFEYSGTAGLSLAGTGTKSVYNNAFYMNRYEMPDGSGGGQLYLGPSSSNSTVHDSTINGNNWQTDSSDINGCYPPPTAQAVYGIEVDPDSYDNYLYGNDVFYNTGAGITANSVAGLTISGYDIALCGYCNPEYVWDNTGDNPPFGNATNGIEINANDGATTGITLNGLLSEQNSGWGVYVAPGTMGEGFEWYQCLDTYSVPTSLTNYTPSMNPDCPSVP